MKRNGFTLVELLVVVAVITILAALLLPTLDNSLTLSRFISCKGQVRQHGVILSLYLDDSRDALPPVIHNGNAPCNSFFNSMDAYQPVAPASGFGVLYGAGYVSDPALFYCPGAKTSRESYIRNFKSLYEARSPWYAFGADYAIGWMMADYGNNTWYSWPVSKYGTYTSTEYLKARKVWIGDYQNPLIFGGFSTVFHNNFSMQNAGRLDGSTFSIMSPVAQLAAMGRTGGELCNSFSSNSWWSLAEKMASK